jgi:hypothetical protein
MIILPHQPNSLFDPSSFGGGNNPESSVGNPESDDGEEPSPSERQFFLSLGLDGGSIDLKAECNNSESSLTGSTIGGNGDTALDELLRNSTNDQLLSKCNAAMMEEAAIGNNNNNCNEDDEDDDDGDEQMMFDNDFGGSQEAESSPDAASSSAAGHHQSSLLLDEKLSDMLSAAGSTALTLAAAKALLQKGGFGGGNNGAKSSFFGGGGGYSSSLNLCGHQQIKLENGFGGGRYDSSGTAEGRPSVDSSVAEGDNNNAAEWTLPASFSAALAALKNDNVVMNNMINNNNSSSRPSSLLAANAFGGDNNKDKGGGPIRTTQCPKCGKHMRKREFLPVFYQLLIL